MNRVVEVWKEIEGCEGLYEISSFGRVKSLRSWNGHKYVERERILNAYTQRVDEGYSRKVVTLSKNKKRKQYKVHRLVANAFILNPNNYPVINHKDGNTFNNHSDNLEWCTQKKNVQHAIEIGLRKVYKPTKEELIDLYVIQRKSLKEISRQNNTNIKTIKKYLDKYGMKARSLSEADTKYFITKSFLEQELKCKTATQISKELGCHQSLISFYKKKFNLKGVVLQ